MVDSIEAVFVVGAPMAVLMPLPLAAVLCAALLVLGFRLRSPKLILASVAIALIGGLLYLALRMLPVPLAVRTDFAESVDSLLLLLPVLLGVAVLPAAVRAIRAGTRALRGRLGAAPDGLSVAAAE